MDKSRRGLSSALVVTEEVEEFVRPSKSSQSHKLVEESGATAITDFKPVAKTAPPVASVEKLPAKPKNPRPGKASKKQSPAAPAANTLSQPRVAITTRFQPATADNLRRTSLERKLAGKSPWSQQEIIEQAVLDWLAENTDFDSTTSIVVRG